MINQEGEIFKKSPCCDCAMAAGSLISGAQANYWNSRQSNALLHLLMERTASPILMRSPHGRCAVMVMRLQPEDFA